MVQGEWGREGLSADVGEVRAVLHVEASEARELCDGLSVGVRVTIRITVRVEDRARELGDGRP